MTEYNNNGKHNAADITGFQTQYTAMVKIENLLIFNFWKEIWMRINTILRPNYLLITKCGKQCDVVIRSRHLIHSVMHALSTFQRNALIAACSAEHSK